MATYAIGDIQGCYNELRQLLEQIRFDPAQDKLWFVGDLVNRGPGSLEVLRLVRSLGDSAITVLGNHDLHLVAVDAGIGQLHRSDTLDSILAAPDRKELLHWLRRQKLAHFENGHLLVHAGVLPGWTAEQAVELAHEVEDTLRGDAYMDFIAHMYGNNPQGWDEELSGYKRQRVIVNAFTRLRICTPQGEMEFKFKGEVENIPEGYLPWFGVPKRKSRDTTVIFGHWSALGLVHKKRLIALDTGCLWGGPMTAIRLEDRQLFQVSCSNPVAKHW
ncbi:MAG: symmetrical bis(5'-nucleosyl)-tetraphosphatase [Nitrosomonadales bacterium]|nr:symmetrical bis(5'-nucleosyl)-tetraphosphatase [Nitrosomonadales bacterium]